MSELRFHPFLGQWVITATHRQERTFHPPADFCPLCPTRSDSFPTEVPRPDYDIVVFENRFPSLSDPPPETAVGGFAVLPVRPSKGICEVVCYSQEHNATLASLGIEQVRKLTRVWQERYFDLKDRDGIEYVFIFENKGKEIGVTLSHPHGQIYAFPYIPPIPARELEQERAHFLSTGRTIYEDWLMEENRDLDAAGNPKRLVTRNESFSAWIPFFARYPYETYIVAHESIGSMAGMSWRQLDDLAEITLDIARRLDGLFGFSMPYIMAMHQEPTVPGYEFTRFHIEFYPPYRTATKLKYLAGSESGAGAFINDTLPEVTALEMRSIQL